MSTKVIFNEINNIKDEFQINILKLEVSLEKLEFEWYRLISLESFTGKTSEKVKMYLQDVHIVLCTHLKNIMYSIKKVINEIMRDYLQNVDSDENSIIYEDILIEAINCIKSYQEIFDEAYSVLKAEMLNIDEILSLDTPSPEKVQNYLNQASGVCSDVSEDMNSFNKMNLSKFEESNQGIDSIKNLIIELKDVFLDGDIKNYSKDILNNNSNYSKIIEQMQKMNNIEIGGVPYSEGLPSEPDLFFDDDFAYDPDFELTSEDELNYLKWKTKLKGAQFLQYLPDGCATYEHYLEGSGTDFEIDFEKAYRQDEGVRNSVDLKKQEGIEAAIEYYKKYGSTSFSITGQQTQNSIYPETENWQKAIGSFSMWNSMDVKVEGNKMVINLTVHELDRYNFNSGMNDITTGTPDDVNGRFEKGGLAKSFYTRGSINRTITIDIGDINNPQEEKNDTSSNRILEGKNR